MKRGSLLLLIGLLCGLALGWSVLWVKRYAARELLGLLAEEVSSSCPCAMQYDSAELSLLTLSGKARNIRIVEGGRTRLFFKRIEANFSLRGILRREIPISLKLIDGLATGVGPESATFRFIDYLSTPAPPGKSKVGRWQLQLERLKVRNSGFTQSLGTVELIGSGGSLDMRRNQSDNFELKPSIPTLKLRHPKLETGLPFREYPLGKASGEILITDNYVDFNRLDLQLRQSWVKARARSDTRRNDALSGDLQFSIEAQSASMPGWLAYIFNGQGQLHGRLGDPSFRAGFTNQAGTPLVITKMPFLPLQLDPVDGTLTFDYNAGEPVVELHDTTASNQEIEISLNRPVRVVDTNVTGSLNLRSGGLRVGDADVEQVEAVLDFEGDFFEPDFKLSGRAGRLLAGGLLAGNVDFEINGSQQATSFRLSSSDFGRGSFNGDGRLLPGPQGETIVDYFNFSMDGVSPLLAAALPIEADSAFAGLKLKSSGSFRGPLQAGRLSGESLLEVGGGPFSSQIPLKGRFAIRDGKISADVGNSSQSVRFSFALSLIDTQSGILTVALSDFRPFEGTSYALPPEHQCGVLTLDGKYTFKLSEPARGSGALNVSKLSLGCEPQNLRIEKPLTIPISDGTARFSQLNLSAGEASLTLSGDISSTSGYDLVAGGSLDLQSLLPLIPALDDMRGMLTVSARIRGPLGHPAAAGTARLRNADFDIESANLSGRAISGQLTLGTERIQFEDAGGRLNEGTFSISGVLTPQNLRDSALNLKLSNLILDPIANLTLSISGDLSLGQDQTGAASVNGDIRIDSATFQKTIDWASIAKSIADAVFEQTNRSAGAGTMPPVNLNVHVTAPRNILVSSNLAGAEMSADLWLSGPLERPVVRGQLDTISGWFGLRDRLFTITNGTIIFVPGSYQPQLEFTGETVIRSREGDNVLIIVEVSGPASAPRLRLSSDRGLSDRELLRLLTSSSDLVSTPRVGTLGQDVEIDTLPFLSDDSMLGLGGLVRRLTRIDSLSLEPQFNSLRGTIEPTAVARKKLLDNLLLVGESSLATTPSESRLRAIYQLLPFVKLMGSADITSNQNNTVFGLDLACTVLSDQVRFLETELIGNSVLSNLELLEALRLTESSRIRNRDSNSICDAARSAYRERGYFHTACQAQCEMPDGAPENYCRRLIITLQESEQSLIQQVELSGDALPPGVTNGCAGWTTGKPASEEVLKTCTSSLTQRLRSEGYIGARVDASYREGGSPLEKVLAIDLYTGDPVTFSFTGNQVFSSAEFLDTINLLKRKQPFGKNTINILLENIDRKYREAGYLLATISLNREQEAATRRVIYHININEGNRIVVSEVVLSGNQALSTEQIRALLSGTDLRAVDSLFGPQYAVAEQIENNLAILKSLYVEEGFPETAISYELIPDRAAEHVMIRYLISEGAPGKADWLRISGWPEGIDLPPKPEAPYSIAKANRYLDQMITVLGYEGYLAPGLSSTFDADSSTLRISVDSGPRTCVSAISIEGNYETLSDTILQNLAVKEGDPWRAALMSESKRRLLRLGLFSRVDMLPLEQPGQGVCRGLLVKVVERPLRTLEIGGGLNSEYGLHIFGQATDRSLFGDGRSLSARLDTYYDEASAQISQGVASFTFANPALASSEFGLVEDLRFQRLKQTTLEWDLDRISLASYLHRSWNEGAVTATAGHTILEEDLNDVPPDAVLSDLDTGSVRLSFLSTRLNFDQRDDPLNPRSGYNVNINSDFSSKALGSDADYVSAGVRFSWLQPLPFGDKRFSLASATALASAWPLGGTEAIPISQRYYLGGRTTVRGFKENSLGPRGDDDSVIGGDISMVQNLELRYLIGEVTSLLIFTDAGGLYLRDKGVDLNKIRPSSGVGLRYLSPIGPIGVDLGFPLHTLHNEDTYRVDFNIGTNF